MLKNKVKLFLLACLWSTALCIVLGLRTAEDPVGISHALRYFREGTSEFSRSTLELKSVISLMNPGDPSTIAAAKAALKHSRMRYKKIEFFMDYFFESSAMIYNRPAKAEVDEPYMEYQQPSGFQVMEALLFDDDPYLHQQELLQQAELLATSAPDLPSLLYGFKGDDKALMESLRLELARVITLSITGYDAPELKTGIMESYESVSVIKDILTPYFKENDAGSLPLFTALNHTLDYLRKNPDFNSFDRMEFLTDYGLPLQEELGAFIQMLHLEVNEKSALNYHARNIYSPDALSVSAFNGGISKHNLQSKVALGKKLFQEKALSGNLKRSCASCHDPAKYFTDGQKTSLAFDDKSHVQRNAPTLLYAGFQYAQFWDGRVTTLEEQVKEVIVNPREMNGDHKVVIDAIGANPDYISAFREAFPAKATSVTMDNLAAALSAYIMKLAPRNAPFDRYMEGDRSAMNKSQVKGFNLFMGKAQCGSCHFAPIFNGLIPPYYKRTEYEVLGTPGNNDFDHLKADGDAGRFAYFPISYYQSAFKTPTVRNAAKTAPYMHNGVFTDLKKVVEFYNRGGGAGLHLTVDQQSLSSKPLRLTDEEVRDIVAFMESLTDELK
jgi:cytochrome c peroxidase